MQKINGILVYPIDKIASMKAQAYLQRDRIRGLFDLTYIYNEKKELLDNKTIDLICDIVSFKGLEQFDYLTKTQSDELIDFEVLKDEFLKMYYSLDLLLVNKQNNENNLSEEESQFKGHWKLDAFGKYIWCND